MLRYDKHIDDQLNFSQNVFETDVSLYFANFHGDGQKSPTSNKQVVPGIFWQLHHSTSFHKLITIYITQTIQQNISQIHLFTRKHDMKSRSDRFL